MDGVIIKKVKYVYHYNMNIIKNYLISNEKKVYVEVFKSLV